MKTPLTRDPITIKTIEKAGSDYTATAEKKIGSANGSREWVKLTAKSTCSAESAANNLALRHFFGGNTNAFVSSEERAAVVLVPLGKGAYRAELGHGNGIPCPKCKAVTDPEDMLPVFAQHFKGDTEFRFNCKCGHGFYTFVKLDWAPFEN